MFAQFDRLALLARQHSRVVSDESELGRDQLLRAGLLDGEQDRRGVTATDSALLERVGDPLGHHGLAPQHRVVHRVLEGYAAVAVALLAEATQQVERNVLAATLRVDHLVGQRLQHSGDNGSTDSH